MNFVLVSYIVFDFSFHLCVIYFAQLGVSKEVEFLRFIPENDLFKVNGTEARITGSGIAPTTYRYYIWFRAGFSLQAE